MHPYPRKDEMFIVISDIAALPLAEAEPEKTKFWYKTDSQDPIIWLLTRSTITNQGRHLVYSVEDLHREYNIEKIRVVWIPLNLKGSNRDRTNYPKEVMEVADGVIKLKDLGKRLNISLRTALAKVWLPKDDINQDLALRLHRLNLALEILSFFWIRCRCIDIQNDDGGYRRGEALR